MPTEKHHQCRMANCNYNSTSLHRHCKTIYVNSDILCEMFKFLIMYFHCAVSMQVKGNYIFFKNATTGEEIIRVKKPMDSSEDEEAATNVERKPEPDNVRENIQNIIDIPPVHTDM